MTCPLILWKKMEEILMLRYVRWMFSPFSFSKGVLCHFWSSRWYMNGHFFQNVTSTEFRVKQPRKRINKRLETAHGCQSTGRQMTATHFVVLALSYPKPEKAQDKLLGGTKEWKINFLSSCSSNSQSKGTSEFIDYEPTRNKRSFFNSWINITKPEVSYGFNEIDNRRL